MNRLRAQDLLIGDLYEAIGCSQGDFPRIFTAINRAEENLVYDRRAGDEGWVGGWSELVFAVNRKNPYITTPRGVARLEAMDVCSRPVPLNNQFYEYMLFGSGRMPRDRRWENAKRWGYMQGFSRNTVPTFTDLSNAPQQIQILATNPNDYQPNAAGYIPRVFVQGLDVNGNPVYTQDGGVTVAGEFVVIKSPYGLTNNQFSFITGLQKDPTQGDIQFWQSDPTWGTAELLSTMEPSETTAWYRRYYINSLPRNCCPSFRPVRVNAQPPLCGCPYEPKEYVQVTALAKLDLVPVTCPTDYLLTQSAEAVISECQSIRMYGMDDAGAKAQGKVYHDRAIEILMGQRVHREGKNTVAVDFKPFGSASLRRQRIGTLK